MKDKFIALIFSGGRTFTMANNAVRGKEKKAGGAAESGRGYPG
jgi:hypothetical protein